MAVFLYVFFFAYSYFDHQDKRELSKEIFEMRQNIKDLNNILGIKYECKEIREWKNYLKLHPKSSLKEFLDSKPKYQNR